MAETVFYVPGNPVPKQSFRYTAGGGYRAKGVACWQNAVGWEARRAMIDRDMLHGPLAVTILFYRKNAQRVDGDNLSKAVLDSLNGIVFQDDMQVIDLHVYKRINRERPGCWVRVQEIEEGSCADLPPS